MSLVLALLAAAAAAAAGPAETPFEASAERFADAAACKAWLASAAADARGAGGYDAVEGPYQLAVGDVRIHMVRAEGMGHRIVEQRCLGDALSGRSWRHSMEEGEEEFTVESAARAAPWLKQGGRQQ